MDTVTIELPREVAAALMVRLFGIPLNPQLERWAGRAVEAQEPIREALGVEDYRDAMAAWCDELWDGRT